MNAEDMIRTWAARKLGVPVEDIESVRFEHEDGYGNDSGTWWPEENDAYAIVKGRGTLLVPTPCSGFDDIPRLLQDILECQATDTST